MTHGHLSYTLNIMAADDLVTKASSVMVLSQFSQNISAKAQELSVNTLNPKHTIMGINYFFEWITVKYFQIDSSLTGIYSQGLVNFSKLEYVRASCSTVN